MNCILSISLIDAYLDGELTQARKTELHAHFDTCAACRNEMERAQRVIRLLREVPVDPPSAGFDERVFAPLRDQRQIGGRSRWFIAGFGSALAASLALWLLAVPLTTKVEQEDDLPTVALEVSQIKSVNLAFNAPREFSRVTLTLELPEHFELDGFAGQKQISWETTLTPGKNVLSLPVIATSARRGVLVARLTRGDKSKSFSVRLVADGDHAAAMVMQFPV